MISQELFDETVLENQDVFELDDEQALDETIVQFQKSGQSLDHLSLTHPSRSNEQRQEHQALKENLSKLSSTDISLLLKRLEVIQQHAPNHPHLFLSLQGPALLLDVFHSLGEETTNESITAIQTILNIVVVSCRSSSANQRRSIQNTVSAKTAELCKTLYSEHDDLRNSLLEFAIAVCQYHETNKCLWKQTGKIVDSWMLALDATSNGQLLQLACRGIAIWTKWDDATAQVSSVHDTCLELFQKGAVPKLVALWEQQPNDNPAALAVIISALKGLALQDDIVQTMVALGVLPLAQNALQQSNDLDIQVAVMGLLRNLAANDDIKTSLCRGSTKAGSSALLPGILQALAQHDDSRVLHEHACGTLAQMALRQPHNAKAILRAGGAELILRVMQRHATAPSLQRQGCLAIRNLASRATEEDRKALLDAGAEAVLRQAGTHQSSVDEAYAALRDLRCDVQLLRVQTDPENQKLQVTTTRMFGQGVESNFRPVF